MILSALTRTVPACIALAACAAILSATAEPPAQDPPNDPALEAAAPPDKLSELDALAGKTWIAEGELKGLGRYRSEVAYEWALDRKFLHRHATMTVGASKRSDIAMIGMNPDMTSLVAWTFNSDGSVTRATETPESAKGKWVFLTAGDGAPAEEADSRVSFTEPTEKGWTLTIEVNRDGAWTQTMAMEYHEKK